MLGEYPLFNVKIDVNEKLVQSLLGQRRSTLKMSLRGTGPSRKFFYVLPKVVHL